MGVRPPSYGSEQQQELMMYGGAFFILLWLRIFSDLDGEDIRPWLAWAPA
jgi:hypothetical protein